MDQLVVETIEKHYEEKDSPYYLAELGTFFREHGIEIPEGIRFKDYLTSRYHGRLVIVQDDLTPARIAVATMENVDKVRRQLSNQAAPLPDGSELDHSRLPFSLIAAFCKIPLPNTKVYYRIVKPFRYETLMQSPGDDYVVIEDEISAASISWEVG